MRKGSHLIVGIVTAIHVVFSLALIFLILLHSGKGSGMSEVFGGGMSSSLGGSTTVERNLDRITVMASVLFSLTTVWLTWLWN